MIIMMWISKIWMEAGAPMEGVEPPQKVSECQNANPHHKTSFLRFRMVVYIIMNIATKNSSKQRRKSKDVSLNRSG